MIYWNWKKCLTINVTAPQIYAHFYGRAIIKDKPDQTGGRLINFKSPWSMTETKISYFGSVPEQMTFVTVQRPKRKDDRDRKSKRKLLAMCDCGRLDGR